jgi:hypothetical protein
VLVSTTGAANSTQHVRLGIYHKSRSLTSFDRPVYEHNQRQEFLFYIGIQSNSLPKYDLILFFSVHAGGRSRGLWMVGPEVGRFSGGLANRGDEECVEDVTRPWKFADTSGWVQDEKLTVSCASVAVGKAKTTIYETISYPVKM